ncbi:MAG: M13 family metallopeptidase [Prevotella sp.]
MKVRRFMTIMAMASATLGATAQDNLTAGISTANLDQSVRPADDFYQFACGGWMKANPLPAAYSRYGSFDKLGENNNKRIKDILDELRNADYKEGTVERKLSDLYKLAIDSVRRNKEGVKPLMPIIEKMEKAKSVAQLFDIQLELAKYGDREFFGAYYGTDRKNSKQNILNVRQGGLTLGQKSYYLDDDQATTAIREAYKKHIVRMFTMFGFSEKAAQKKMENIMRLETTLAKASKAPAELRNPEANYHRMTRSDFNNRYPSIKLDKLLVASGIDLKYVDELVVGQPEFMDAANSLIGSLKADEYRDYMEWGQIMDGVGYLSDDVIAANFDFFGKTMSGRKENYPLWKRATQQVEGVLGQALGKIYVEKYFPASSKERMVTLVKNLQKALGERINEQDWMSEETKKNAQEKLSTFYVKIGYPDKWDDFSGLAIDPAKSYYENIQECARFLLSDMLDKTLGKPVDKDKWGMTPQTVNAYYNPTTNEICFPAGILQPPFFDADADDAFNYGAIGVVIGHEMTHGFDDSGRNYDKDGNMKDWWTQDDAKKFNEKADMYDNFFSAIKVLPDLNANGRFTLGENLADHGGLQVAYTAFKNATKESTPADKDGYTADQRFFMAYAGVWAGNITDEEIRNRTKSDPHSLSRWRVNGALPHIDAWYEAFGVKEGDKLYLPKSQRLELW